MLRSFDHVLSEERIERLHDVTCSDGIAYYGVPKGS